MFCELSLSLSLRVSLLLLRQRESQGALALSLSLFLSHRDIESRGSQVSIIRARPALHSSRQSIQNPSELLCFWQRSTQFSPPEEQASALASGIRVLKFSGLVRSGRNGLVLAPAWQQYAGLRSSRRFVRAAAELQKGREAREELLVPASSAAGGGNLQQLPGGRAGHEVQSTTIKLSLFPTVVRVVTSQGRITFRPQFHHAAAAS